MSVARGAAYKRSVQKVIIESYSVDDSVSRIQSEANKNQSNNCQ